MHVLCKEGDKFGVGNGVTLEILTITSEAVEVRVITPEGTYVELMEGDGEVNHTEEMPTQSSPQRSNVSTAQVHTPVNRIKSYFLNG